MWQPIRLWQFPFPYTAEAESPVQYYDRAAKTLGRKQEKGLLERLAENKAQVKEQAEKAPKEKTAAKQEPSL